MNYKQYFKENGQTILLPEFFADGGVEVEELYQAFKARLMDELSLSGPIPVVQGYFSKGDGDGGSKIIKDCEK